MGFWQSDIFKGKIVTLAERNTKALQIQTFQPKWVKRFSFHQRPQFLVTTFLNSFITHAVRCGLSLKKEAVPTCTSCRFTFRYNFLGCARNKPVRALYSRRGYLASEKKTSILRWLYTLGFLVHWLNTVPHVQSRDTKKSEMPRRWKVPVVLKQQVKFLVLFSHMVTS